jgi:formylglycine-generating enzyme required for sulfatase activity
VLWQARVVPTRQIRAPPKALLLGLGISRTPAPRPMRAMSAPVPRQPRRAKQTAALCVGQPCCDAAAFCAWADKRLCGRIGGGELALAELADASKSEWFAACAGPKAQAYPYGVTYQSGACNDKQGAKALVPVGNKTTCRGYYPGLFDMLGNAQEWTAACDARSGRQDGCETIGGSYLASTVCSQSSLAMRELQDAAVGFRCCSQ